MNDDIPLRVPHPVSISRRRCLSYMNGSVMNDDIPLRVPHPVSISRRRCLTYMNGSAMNDDIPLRVRLTPSCSRQNGFLSAITSLPVSQNLNKGWDGMGFIRDKC